MDKRRGIVVATLGDCGGDAVAERLRRIQTPRVSARLDGDLDGDALPDVDLIVVCVGGTDTPADKRIEAMLEDPRGCPVLVVLNQLGDVEKVAQWLRKGVQGCILTGAADALFEEAVRKALQGERFLCPEVRDALASRYLQDPRAPEIE